MDTKILFIDVLTYLFAAVVFFMLPLFALWDMYKKKGKTNPQYVIWVCVILFVPMFGSVSYFFFGRSEHLK
jgi:O-antigen ligase